MEKIILGSASPRRQEILTRLGLPFDVIIPQVDESSIKAPSVEELVEKLALEKVKDVALKIKEENRRWILGVDTVVSLDDKVLCKPDNRDEAAGMLRRLSGRSHKVLSGIALLPFQGKEITVRSVISEVQFRSLEENEIEFYLNTGEWTDAAGGYKIQERAAFFIDWIKGSYSNIVGLPISVFYVMLKEYGYSFRY